MLSKRNVSTRRQFLVTSSLALFGGVSSGCGTLLYDERIGQPRGGMDDIDWTVAGMNAIGLVFFFVPGVIAFAIDYYNGALFYPPEYCGELRSKQLNSIPLPEGQVSLTKVENLISSEIGKPVSLRSPNVVFKEFPSIKSFWKTYEEIVAKV